MPKSNSSGMLSLGMGVYSGFLTTKARRCSYAITLRLRD